MLSCLDRQFHCFSCFVFSTLKLLLLIISYLCCVCSKTTFLLYLFWIFISKSHSPLTILCSNQSTLTDLVKKDISQHSLVLILLMHWFNIWTFYVWFLLYKKSFHQLSSYHIKDTFCFPLSCLLRFHPSQKSQSSFLSPYVTFVHFPNISVRSVTLIRLFGTSSIFFIFLWKIRQNTNNQF